MRRSLADARSKQELMGLLERENQKLKEENKLLHAQVTKLRSQLQQANRIKEDPKRPTHATIGNR